MYTDKLISVKRSTEPRLIMIRHHDVFFVNFTVLQYYRIIVAHHTYTQTHMPRNKLIVSRFCIMMHLILTLAQRIVIK